LFQDTATVHEAAWEPPALAGAEPVGDVHAASAMAATATTAAGLGMRMIDPPPF
jgi:hypothetical protein